MKAMPVCFGFCFLFFLIVVLSKCLIKRMKQDSLNQLI